MSCLIYVGLQQQDSNQISENSTNINHQKLVERESVQALNERGPKAFAKKNPVLKIPPQLSIDDTPIIIYQYKATNSSAVSFRLRNEQLAHTIYVSGKQKMYVSGNTSAASAVDERYW